MVVMCSRSRSRHECGMKHASRVSAKQPTSPAERRYAQESPEIQRRRLHHISRHTHPAAARTHRSHEADSSLGSRARSHAGQGTHARRIAEGREDADEGQYNADGDIIFSVSKVRRPAILGVSGR